jgi:hypothetical protein
MLKRFSGSRSNILAIKSLACSESGLCEGS